MYFCVDTAVVRDVRRRRQGIDDDVQTIVRDNKDAAEVISKVIDALDSRLSSVECLSSAPSLSRRRLND